ncbi:hypothetical protein pb186bvf_006478 [Paramecium bursaria]
MFLYFLIVYKVQSLDIPLLNLQQLYYTIPLIIEGKTYNLVLDTGSPILWVDGNKFEMKSDCVKSESHIVYAKGKVQGCSTNTNVSLIKENFVSIMIAQDIQDINFQADGIIGFSQFVDDQINLIEVLFENQVIKNKSIGLYLTDKYCKQESVLTLGGFRQDLFKEQLKYAPVKHELYWNVEFKEVAIISNVKQIIQTRISHLMIDSGTSRITLPQYEFEQFMHQLGDCDKTEHNGQITMECRQQAQFPQFQFQVQDFYLTLLPQDYINECYNKYFIIRSCIMNFQQINGQEIVLGVVFMQKYYTHFDYFSKKIGFAVNTAYNRDKLNINDLGEDVYSVLYFSAGFVAVILLISFITMWAFIQYTIPLYQTVLEKSSSRSQEQDNEMVTLKTQSIPSMSP